MERGWSRALPQSHSVEEKEHDSLTCVRFSLLFFFFFKVVKFFALFQMCEPGHLHIAQCLVHTSHTVGETCWCEALFLVFILQPHKQPGSLQLIYITQRFYTFLTLRQGHINTHLTTRLK